MITFFDLKHAAHRLARDYKYSLTILISMTLGLAVFLFLFSQVYLRGYASLEFEDGDRFVYASRYENEFARLNGGLQDYDVNYILKRQNVLNDAAAIENRNFTLMTPRFTEQLFGVATSSTFFRLVGVQPYLGRVFNERDDIRDASPVAVISYKTWSHLFQKDQGVVGKIVQIDGNTSTVVGVMPKDFRFPINHDIWVSYVHPNPATPQGSGWSAIIGKLKDNTSLENANEQFESLADEIQKSYPAQYAGKSVKVQKYTKAYAGPSSLLIKIMAVVAASILLMSCFSVVSLIWVRMLENSKEFAIKSALGIKPFNMVAPPLLESLILCTLAGVAGTLICSIFITIMGSNLESSFNPYWWQLQMTPEVVVAAIIFTLSAWFFTGIVPLMLALRRPKLSLLSGGKKGGGNTKAGPIMGVLVSLQISCAFILMVFTGICLVTLVRVINADYGVETKGFLTARLQPAETLYPDLLERNIYYERLASNMKQLSGVSEVAFAAALPGSFSYLSTYNSVEFDLSRNGANPQATEIPISENFFETFNVQLPKGRPFIETDSNTSELVTIISEKMEKKISPNGSAIGKKIHLNPDRNGPLLTIVGVAPDLIYGPPISLYETELDVFYRPMKQVLPSWYGMTMAIKTTGNPYELEASALKTAREIDPQVAMTSIVSYQDSLKLNGNDFRSLVYNFAPATLLAFLMATLGIYAINARVTLQKTTDIGIMKAIGIQNTHIVKTFMQTSLWKIVGGLLLGGFVFVLFAPGLIGNLVVLDSTVLILSSSLIGLLLGLVATLASFIPLLKAINVSPSKAING